MNFEVNSKAVPALKHAMEARRRQMAHSLHTPLAQENPFEGLVGFEALLEGKALAGAPPERLPVEPPDTGVLPTADEQIPTDTEMTQAQRGVRAPKRRAAVDIDADTQVTDAALTLAQAEQVAPVVAAVPGDRAARQDAGPALPASGPVAVTPPPPPPTGPRHPRRSPARDQSVSKWITTGQTEAGPASRGKPARNKPQEPEDQPVAASAAPQRRRTAPLQPEAPATDSAQAQARHHLPLFPEAQTHVSQSIPAPPPDSPRPPAVRGREIAVSQQLPDQWVARTPDGPRWSDRAPIAAPADARPYQETRPERGDPAPPPANFAPAPVHEPPPPPAAPRPASGTEQVRPLNLAPPPVPSLAPAIEPPPAAVAATAAQPVPKPAAIEGERPAPMAVLDDPAHLAALPPVLVLRLVSDGVPVTVPVVPSVVDRWVRVQGPEVRPDVPKTLQISLAPPDLGPMTIQFSIDAQRRISVEMAVGTPLAKAALDSQMLAIRQIIQVNQFQVGELTAHVVPAGMVDGPKVTSARGSSGGRNAGSQNAGEGPAQRRPRRRHADDDFTVGSY